MVQYESIIALYDNMNQAENAIDELLKNGYRRENISLIANDASGEYKYYMEEFDGDDDDDVDGDEGAGFGAVIGTLTGLGIAVLPGVGPVFALGPLAAALISGIGAASGAATGGLAAGLIDLGADDDTAQLYAEGVRRGGIMVVVRTAEEDEDEVMSILDSYNPVDMDDRDEAYRADDWSGFDETTDEPYTVDEINDYRAQYTTDDTITAEVVEEDIKIGKRGVEEGGVRVRKFITEDTVSEDIDLRREEIHVERTTVDRPATDADFNTFEEGTITMTETDEEVVVEKEARVVEEVEISKEVEYETETVEGTVRRTDVEVEEIDNP